MRSPSVENIKKWHSLLLKYLDVKKQDTDFNNIFEANETFDKWFPGYEINVYKNLIQRHLKINKNKACILYLNLNNNKEIYTYSEIDILVKKLVFEIDFENLKKIAIIGSPCPETFISVLASAYLGCHHTVLIPVLSQTSIKKRLEIFQPDIILNCSNKILKNHNNISISKLEIENKKIYINGELIKQKEKNDASKSNIYKASQPLFTLFTSGSTGFPKGITHSSIGYLMFSAYTASYYFNLNSKSLILCGSETGWINGHTYSIYAPLINSATSILISDPACLSNPKYLEDCIEKCLPSILYLPVTTVRLLKAAYLNRKKRVFKSIKSLGTMGEMLAPSIDSWFSSQFSKIDLPIVNTYFQTETGGILCAKNYKSNPGIKPGEIGYLPWYLSIESNEKRLKLTSSLPGMMIGLYANDYDKTSSNYFQNGCFNLNDYGYISESKLFVEGRTDDVVNIKGMRFTSGEIESSILSLDSITECAAVEHKNKLGITTLLLFIVSPIINNSNELTILDYTKRLLPEIRKKIIKDIGTNLNISEIVFVKTLPKTPSGKILRRYLREFEYDKIKFNQKFTGKLLLDKAVKLEVTHII